MKMFWKTRIFYNKVTKKCIEHVREKFLHTIDNHGCFLDVGCGNNAPYAIKSQFPKLYYIGLDVGDYNQTKPNLADEYIVTSGETFAEKILQLTSRFDSVLSNHNFEHVNDRDKTLEAMLSVLKPGGYIYMAFPSEKSVNFPSRGGCLNYYDDSSHTGNPPNFNQILKIMNDNNMKIIFASPSYKPFFRNIIGFILETKSKKENRVNEYTWAYWGFEAIIWAKKK